MTPQQELTLGMAAMSLVLAVLGIGWMRYFLVDPWWSPQSVVNRVFRRVGVPYSWWWFGGRFYSFRDERGSVAACVVAAEIQRGLYDVELRAGDVVVDLGAHVGMFCIPLAKRNPGVKFVAFEPDPRNYENLLLNIEDNCVDNVEAIRAGLAPEFTLLESQVDGGNTGSNVSRPSKTGNVVGFPLESILANWKPSVLKVDVEGAEFGTITKEGLKGIECLVMEVHGDKGDASVMLEVACSVPRHTVQVIRAGELDGVYRNGKPRVKAKGYLEEGGIT